MNVEDIPLTFEVLVTFEYKIELRLVILDDRGMPCGYDVEDPSAQNVGFMVAGYPTRALSSRALLRRRSYTPMLAAIVTKDLIKAKVYDYDYMSKRWRFVEKTILAPSIATEFKRTGEYKFYAKIPENYAI